jgi:hypothetical protein
VDRGPQRRRGRTRRRRRRRDHRPARPRRLAERHAGHSPARTPRHRGAQLRFDDVDGYQITAFATNTTRGQLPDLELRHRRRARCEDRIRIAKDTALRNLPLQGYGQNQVWCEIVALATDLLAWMALLGLDGHNARRWEPKRLRLRLFTAPAHLATSAHKTRLRFADHHPWAWLVAQTLARLRPPALSPGAI